MTTTNKLLWLSCLLAASACSSESNSVEVNAPSSPELWSYTPPARATCTTTVNPSSNDHDAVLGALIGASEGDVICFGAGTFNFSEELSLTVNNVTLQGAGSGANGTIWNFAGQVGNTGAGANGLHVMADGFTMREMWVKNTPGDSVRVSNRMNVKFQGVKVSWDAGSNVMNGAYALYPIGCTNVLVEGCEIIGAADAGIYVGQSHNVLVRNNNAHGNVAGVEIENCVNSEVHGNIAWDNTAGILVFDLPGLPAGNGHTAFIHDNTMKDNNRANFAREGTVVASVPPGIGFMSLASKITEITHNNFSGNGSTGAVIVSYPTLQAISGTTYTDANYDAYVREINIHQNVWTNNGKAPSNNLAVTAIRNSADPVLASLEDVLWDGIANPNVSGNLVCIDDDSTFRNFDGQRLTGGGTAMPSTDIAPHACTFASLSPVVL